MRCLLDVKYHIHDKGIIIDPNQLNFIAYVKKELALLEIVNGNQSRATNICVRFISLKFDPR
jgi:hypothetical protein